MGNLFRKLRADEIECRVAQVGTNYCTLLLYKDARCDMNILDETIGSMNWQRKHLRENQNCIVSIWDESKQIWVEKEDTGTESNTEKEKGLASDSFKRACFNWGIGRELYTAPKIFVNLTETDYTKGDKPKVNQTFDVIEIGYDESGNINQLKIVDKKRVVRYELGKSQTTPPQNQTAQPKQLTPEQIKLQNDWNAKKLQIEAEIKACTDVLMVQITADNYPEFAKVTSFKKLIADQTLLLSSHN